MICSLHTDWCVFQVDVYLHTHCCVFQADVFMQAMRPQSAQTLEIDAMCDMSHYGGSLRTMTPNEDWTTIFERESTTESIPVSDKWPLWR